MTFAISVAAMTVLSLLIGFGVHEYLLGAEYRKLTSLFRAPEDAEKYFGYMLLAHLFMGVGLTWIYRQGRQAKPWLAQGVRFGIAISVLIVVPMYLIYFAVQPMPAGLVLKQIIFDTIGMIVLGIVAAWINKRDFAGTA